MHDVIIIMSVLNVMTSDLCTVACRCLLLLLLLALHTYVLVLVVQVSEHELNENHARDTDYILQPLQTVTTLTHDWQPSRLGLAPF